MPVRLPMRSLSRAGRALTRRATGRGATAPADPAPAPAGTAPAAPVAAEPATPEAAPAAVAPAATVADDQDPRAHARLATARAIAAEPGRPDWPVSVVDPFPGVRGALPEITLPELTTEVMAGALLHHGALVVRGMLDPTAVERLDAGMTHTQEARGVHDGARACPPWFVPFRTDRPTLGEDAKAHSIRLVDAPPLMDDVLATYRETGILGAVEEYFGEPAVFTANKAVLRYLDVPEHISTDWHQDGRFMGADVRSVNVWVTLTDCGTDAPALDVLPRREVRIHPTGNGTSFFDWTIGDHEVVAMAGDTPPVRLQLAAGDGVIFDHYLVHRTGYAPEMTRQRRAVECWFFAPSHAPGDYVSLVA